VELEQQRHGIANCTVGSEHAGLVCGAPLPIGEKERTATIGLTDQFATRFRWEAVVSVQRLTDQGGVSGLNDWNRYVGAALSFRY
jgi:hypothetical protein